MLNCKNQNKRIKLRVKNGTLEILTPNGAVQGKRLVVSGIKENKEGKLITFTISFELLKENVDLDLELKCYYDEFIKEVIILYDNGKKWKIPAGYSSMEYKGVVEITVNCQEGVSDDFRERFNKIDPEKITARSTSDKIEIYTNNHLCITGKELKVLKGGYKYELSIRSGCGSSYDNIKEFLYLDSFYDEDRKLPALLLEVRGEKYKIPFTKYLIFNLKIVVSKINGF